ncbi:hypothetical protein ACJMK2_005673 [Sinanodonta woodiana]
MYCKITGSSKLGNTSAKQVTRNPCLQDVTHFHLPVDVYMPVTLGYCDEAEIVVMVSKPINSDSQMDENFSAMFQPPMHFSPDSPPAQISATQDLPVRKSLHNLCKKIVSIENCLVVPDASPKSLESSNCSGSNFKENHHR